MNGDPTETFLLAPPREGRPAGHGLTSPPVMNFYSRPYARGDLKTGSRSGRSRPFLLTPLREGRHVTMMAKECVRYISTHAPARGATGSLLVPPACQPDFYSRPYARGDRRSGCAATWRSCYFYSRPYARGDRRARCPVPRRGLFLLTPLREGRRAARRESLRRG